MRNLIASWGGVWRAQRAWLVRRMLCALVWAFELFWIQSLAFEAVPWVGHPWLMQGFRFFLDLLVALALALLLRRRVLGPVLGLNLLMLAVLGTYAANFHRPLLPVRAFYQWHEGWSMSSRFQSIMPWETLAVVLGAGALQYYLLWKSASHTVAVQVRRATAGLLACLLAVSVTGMQFTNSKLRVDVNGGMGRAVYTYGYTLPWICDLLANRDTEAHSRRAQEYLTHHYDRLSPIEAPIAIPSHCVVLQLETLGGASIAAEVNGEPVMPFLRELKERSLYFRIMAFHKNGSCDMDYAATTGCEPYPGMVPYRVPGLTYTHAMPPFMEAHGFASYFYHGNTALFYDRGPMMEQLGFDHIFFKEQLIKQRLPTSQMGIRDAALFDCLIAGLRREARAYIFAISLDTHTPFRQLLPAENELFPEPNNAPERYLNALRYLDNCLRNFFLRLPSGVTVVLYGDHTASMNSARFQSDVWEGREYVPCLIHQTGINLAPLQQTRRQAIATDGTLNLLDIMNYLRGCVDRAPVEAVPNLPLTPSPPLVATNAPASISAAK